MNSDRLKSIFGRALISFVVTVSAGGVYAQKKKSPPTPRPAAVENESELSKLHDSYIKATREYKASLEKLLKSYQESARKAEERVSQLRKLLVDGLVSRRDVEQSETVLADANLKVLGAQQQIATADTQIAQVFLEVEAEKQISKLGSAGKGRLLTTASFIRFTGAGSWVLSQAGRVESFFQQTFKRPLPIAVFGQGAIHNQWRLDHRNAMDISLHPDGVEGQALMQYLRNNGIPFSAFRGAIPGVATGPHIHIGAPSHRY